MGEGWEANPGSQLPWPAPPSWAVCVSGTFLLWSFLWPVPQNTGPEAPLPSVRLEAGSGPGGSGGGGRMSAEAADREAATSSRPCTPPQTCWFEFLLEESLLEKHLRKPCPGEQSVRRALPAPQPRSPAAPGPSPPPRVLSTCGVASLGSPGLVQSFLGRVSEGRWGGVSCPDAGHRRRVSPLSRSSPSDLHIPNSGCVLKPLRARELCDCGVVAVQR